MIDAGADIEADGASIGGGTPLDDAVGYGCWHVAWHDCLTEAAISEAQARRHQQ